MRRAARTTAQVKTVFVGGVGDFSALLDQAQQYLYVFYSQYASRETVQGVAVARMVWADRDDPVGKMTVWQRNQTWLPARITRARAAAYYAYPPGAPIYRAGENWHGPSVDAFWGPSVHWNTHLQQYVMLLNRARDSAWTQDGIYVAFSRNSQNRELVNAGTPGRRRRLVPAGVGHGTREWQRSRGRGTRALLSGWSLELLHRIQQVSPRSDRQRTCHRHRFTSRDITVVRFF